MNPKHISFCGTNIFNVLQKCTENLGVKGDIVIPSCLLQWYSLQRHSTVVHVFYVWQGICKDLSSFNLRRPTSQTPCFASMNRCSVLVWQNVIYPNSFRLKSCRYFVTKFILNAPSLMMKEIQNIFFTSEEPYCLG